MLGHGSRAGSRSGVIGIYQAYDYDREAAAALEAWGAHVSSLIEGQKPGKLLPLRDTR